MSRKIYLSIISIFFLSSCNYLFLVSQISSGEKPDVISMEMTSSVPNNHGNLIALSVLGQNFPWRSEEKKKEIESKNYSRSSPDYPFNEKRCEDHSEFSFTYFTPKKTSKEEQRKWVENDDFKFVRRYKLPDGKDTWEIKGHYRINRSNIYLIHKGKNILPDKIFWRDTLYDNIDSSSVSYSNYDRYGTHYLTFPIPCNELARSAGVLSDTKLIISKIYKDDKVIRKDIEFRFIKSKENRGGTIWLE